MTEHEAAQPRRSRRLVTVTLVFASLALNAVLVWRWFERDSRTSESTGVAAPEAGPQAQSTEGIPERPRSVEVPSQPGGDSPATPIKEPYLAPPEAAGVPPNAQPPEPGVPRGAIAVPPLGASAPGPSQAVPPAPSVRTEPPAAPSANPQIVGTVVHREGAVPPEAGAASRGGSTTPSPTGAATPHETPTPSPTPPVEIEPDSDRKPPVLGGIRFEPPDVEGGNATTLVIQASDDLSGVKSVRGEIRSPNRLAALPFGSQVGGDVNVFSFPITVPREAESGVWYVSWLSVTDGADNALLIQASSPETSPPGATFSVHSPESDSTAPEVLGIRFDKTTVDGGEKNVIEVEARDDDSGVVSILGACQSPSKSALIWFYCSLNKESGFWQGDVLVPKNADCGDWSIQQLVAKDKAGNTTLLSGTSPLLAGIGFQVSFRADCDSTPPSLDSFDLFPRVVSSDTATEILVTAKVYDAGSGAVAMTGWFEGPVAMGGQTPRNSFTCSPDPYDPSTWTCKIAVPRFAAKGTWKVGGIRLQDKAFNSREYTSADPVLSGRVFEVQ